MLAIQTTTQSRRKQFLNNAALVILGVVFFYALLAHPVFATSTGGTGSVAATQARVGQAATGFYMIMLSIGASILSAAFLYVGYGMAFNGKKWSDVANVVYGALIAGLGTALVGWLFS